MVIVQHLTLKARDGGKTRIDVGGRCQRQQQTEAKSSRIATFTKSQRQQNLMNYSELPEVLPAIGIEPSMIRLSVWIEDTDDVGKDILGALDRA